MNQTSELEARDSYLNYLNRCNTRMSKESYWWYLPSSSKDRYSSATQNDYIKGSIENRLTTPLGKKYIKRLLCLISISRTIALYNIVAIKNKFRKYKLSHSDKKKIVFFHPIHNRPVNHDYGYKNNVYFGELPFLYCELGYQVFIMGLPSREHFFRATLYEEKSLTVLNLLCLLTFRDVIKSLYYLTKSVFDGLPLAPTQSKHEKYLRILIKDEKWTSLNQIFTGKLLSIIIENFLKFQNVDVLFSTYENNWWERAVYFGAKSSSFNGRYFGFLHCAILNSHLKFSLGKDEWNQKPSPDNLIVTGELAKLRLNQLGHYPNDIFITGFDLRGPSILSVKPVKNRLKNLNSLRILILLEGLESMANFLDLIIKPLQNLHLSITIRCHPVMPISSSIFSEVRKAFDSRYVKISENKNLLDDISAADLAIYKGSTAAVYTAYAGIPLLRYDDGYWASDDPLEGCQGLIENFSDECSLVEKLNYILNMENGLYEQKKDKMKKFVETYFSPYSKVELCQFAKSLVVS